MARDDKMEDVRKLYEWVVEELTSLVWAVKGDNKWIFKDYAKGQVDAFSKVKLRMEKYFKNVIDVKKLPGGNNGKV